MLFCPEIKFCAFTSLTFNVTHAPKAALRWTCCLCTVGQVVHTLSEGEPVFGVTSLGDEVFVLRWKERDQVEVYDVITYRLLRCLAVSDNPRFRPMDMTSCEYHCCLYMADFNISSISRLDLQGATIQWAVNDNPRGLSVNKAHNLLVTSANVRKIKEFSSHGDLICVLTLPDDIISPWHAIQLTTGQFVVCHGGLVDQVHGVCLLSADCTHTDHAHCGQRGSDTGQYNVPIHLAVDDNEFVFVADLYNRRVTLLSPTLNYIRQVVSSDKLNWEPRYLYLDVQRRRLYVGESERKDYKYTSGRVVVFSV